MTNHSRCPCERGGAIPAHGHTAPPTHPNTHATHGHTAQPTHPNTHATHPERGVTSTQGGTVPMSTVQLLPVDTKTVFVSMEADPPGGVGVVSNVYEVGLMDRLSSNTVYTPKPCEDGMGRWSRGEQTCNGGSLGAAPTRPGPLPLPHSYATGGCSHTHPRSAPHHHPPPPTLARDWGLHPPPRPPSTLTHANTLPTRHPPGRSCAHQRRSCGSRGRQTPRAGGWGQCTGSLT